MNLREIIWLVVIGILLAGVGFLGYKTISSGKRVNVLTNELVAVRNAPVQVDTVHDSIVLPGGVIIKPISVKVIVHDTVLTKITESWYDSTYKSGGLRFRWKSRIMGSMQEISFSDFVIPKEIITIRKPFDTCYEKPPAYIAKNHLGFDFDLIGNDVARFPNLDLVGWWSIKDRFKLNMGVEYSAYHKEVYGKVGLGIFLR